MSKSGGTARRAAVGFAAALVLGMTWAAGLGWAAQLGNNPQPIRAKLAASTEVDGVPCAAGYYWRYSDGRLRQCVLSRAATVRGVSLPAKSTVAFNADGSHAFVFLPGTTTFEGHACRGEGHGYMTTFHENGRLKLCWLEKPEVIDGVPCAKATFLGEVFGGSPGGVYFHDDGRLEGCRANRDVTIDGRHYRKGERVERR